ncbi:MAG: DUF4942 domain-containing protein [Candidatus Gastranaerophilales bacterium]|nr:DUF4942 domain-containing protein [Candidatus Gastranaerophilales bacterium]
MGIQQTLIELKENNEDFELYPSSREMLWKIYEVMDTGSKILDIGCGTCNFKKYAEEFDKINQQKYFEDIDKYNKKLIDRYPDKPCRLISKYYVIEKSKILIDKFDKDTIVLGTDFYNTLLIDKKADTYFCNPPYSEYVEWTTRILADGNFKEAFLIIPQRWKENEQINLVLKKYDIQNNILGSFDFLQAERPARAKVDVVRFTKNPTKYDYRWRDLNDFNEKAFDNWFDETFKMRDSAKENKYESEIEREEKQNIKNQLVGCKSKGDFLVNLYNEEQKKLFEQFQAICSLDTDTLLTIGVKKEAIKEAIKQKIVSLKTKYWRIVFDEFEEITERLTSETRRQMFDRFKELQTVDFTLENIYPLILWVIKNANGYYDEQLISFFKKLSSPDNVKPYKSNQKVFERDKWRHNSFADEKKVSHYTLDYRIIMSSPFRTDYYGRLDGFDYGCSEKLQDIFTIAKNLGFKIGLCDIPKNFGEKCFCLYGDSDKTFMEYRAYKNGNMHVKFDIEFAKALNVETSRLLGWIRSKEDIEKEFPQELAKGAEKYFKINNYVALNVNNVPLLGILKD